MAGTITHYWNGTVLTVVSDSGSSSCDLKGDKGDMGVRGAQGVAGEAGTVSFNDLTPEQRASLKGDKGDTGAAGKEGLSCKRSFGNRYAVDALGSTKFITFNRVPEVGEVFNTLCAGRYITFFEVRVVNTEAETVSIKSIFEHDIKGATGAAGYTPIKGTDYWTEADKAEIKLYVDDAILNGKW